jgi:hypothetical protein
MPSVSRKSGFHNRPHRAGRPSFRKVLPLALCGLLGWCHCGRYETGDPLTVPRPPKMDPDFASIVIPPNIAPLNFIVNEPGERYRVRLSSGTGESIDLTGRSPGIRIPAAAWGRICRSNAGGSLTIVISVRQNRRWSRFQTVTNRISRDPIDPFLAYRVINPAYTLSRRMGIFQRNLETFDEEPILRNDALSNCINCHSFRGRSPLEWTIQTRFTDGGLLISTGGAVKNVNTVTRINPLRTAYTAWHPGGRVVAFSTDKVKQFFHAAGENRDVIDLYSDLFLYHVDSDSMSTAPGIADPKRMETLPEWSPDGRFLYFCSAPALDSSAAAIDQYSKVRYDLVRASYDAGTGAWGKPETVLASSKTGLSISFPKISPDGSNLLFCMAEYGYFTIYRPDCELYLMDLKTGGYRRLPINSDQSDSYHAWSGNSRWIVFSSKRRDGVCTRLYFSHVDSAGNASKPFVLPQKDPTFYGRFFGVYNVPEFILGEVKSKEGDLIEDLRRTDRIVQTKPMP